MMDVDEMMMDIESLDDQPEETRSVASPTSSSRQHLDCYPYTFSPLLLFADGYFDKGHSNYNAVAAFFQNAISANQVDLMQNVIYEPRNMIYEELLEHIEQQQSLVICCIDAHFTAFQVVRQNNNGKTCAIYYDPLINTLQYIPPNSFRLFATYKLIKCHYGDSQHVQENKEHYTGLTSANPTRRMIYKLWDKINTLHAIPYKVQQRTVALELNRHVLINDATNHQLVATQLTGNTCYFQVFLFALLCKIGQFTVSANEQSLQFDNARVQALEQVMMELCHYCLTFFVTSDKVLRPLSNANVVIDFYRYKSAVYYKLFWRYLQDKVKLRNNKVVLPDYESQYHQLLQYYTSTGKLHTYDKCVTEGAMASAANTKTLQMIHSVDAGTVDRLARSDYYKYRACNFMLGCNTNLTMSLTSFADLQALRKNQLLRYYHEPSVHASFANCAQALNADSQTCNKYRDYYFMPQFEIGQQELIDLHHYLYLLDLYQLDDVDDNLVQRIHAVNHRLVHDVYFSTQGWDYDKIQSTEDFKRSKKAFRGFANAFLAPAWFQAYVGLGFAEVNPKEKEINSLTQTVFYDTSFIAQTMSRPSYEFEKECINQMARSTLRKHKKRVEGDMSAKQTYKVSIRIGYGYTYSKYNTLMHFLNVVSSYWQNPDLSNIQVFGKDIRTLLAVSCQKIFFDEGRHCGYYHYGPFEAQDLSGNGGLDLAVGADTLLITPSVARKKRKSRENQLIVADRVYEFHYIKEILKEVFYQAQGEQFKSDNEVLNLCLLSLMLDFGLYAQYVSLLRLSFLQCLQHQADTRELQVEIANLIYEFDRKNTTDSVTRAHVVELLFESSYRFLVNKGIDVRSKQAKLIRLLNADPDYQSYVLLCKIYMSLCQINRSTEVDYYKVHCHETSSEVHSEGEFKIIIPHNYSKATCTYLEEVTKRYTFSETDGIMSYDDQPVFDLRPQQPEINLFRVRFYSGSEIQSMVKYIEMTNVFRVEGDQEKYLAFIADNVLRIDVRTTGEIKLRISRIDVEMATVFFNEAVSFIPCYKYADSEDIILFTSPNLMYMVDKGGQFAPDYYGMKHELLECIASDEGFVDLNDEHAFKEYRLCELLGESKTVIYYPDYLLQVSTREQLIDLLDLAVKVRNISFFVLVLFYLRRTSIKLSYYARDGKVAKISGPWYAAISYVLSSPRNAHYDDVFRRQFFDLDQHEHAPLDEFIDIVCENFTKYQGVTDDGEYRIVPRPKQKKFLKRIICAREPFHFSEVGSGKTKVILPLLCQIFLSNNAEAHKYLARGGQRKEALVILVPEHLVNDARTQIYRYCLNLNFRKDYRVYDDIFSLMHAGVKLGGPDKQIFVTTFNQFKKALTYDRICSKVRPNRGKILVVADEVDDFLERNKLVFNICSNKASSFDRPTLDLYFETSRAAYRGNPVPPFENSSNPDYWRSLYGKFRAIQVEIQDASRSINRSFGIFNAHTLRHCSTNIAHDIEGYKSLIARPYESVNRAMPGSYYSDVERTIFLTYVILSEDISKYNDLFQGERKFITFEYWNNNFIHQLDFDDLVYGHQSLSEIVEKHPETRDGLAKFLYEIILRRMEIRDKSRSVNSIDVVFNFDCMGFTGTPFLDNYPTFDYIRRGRKDDIPDLIDRSFYAYSSDILSPAEFERRFSLFQGQNNDVTVKYVCSDFMRNSPNEMAVLKALFEKEEIDGATTFNAIVDLCGIFKRSDVYDVRNLIIKHFGLGKFHYVYHVDQTDGSDRVLCLDSENDAQYDEEFYKFMCKKYGPHLRDRIFFMIDNRNVIGKDVPFQLAYQRQFGKPLFTKSVVIAHDVDDFSKIWQAMGRSRTMNDTVFSIYKSGLRDVSDDSIVQDIKRHDITRELYVRNCDCKIAGNISSMYLTLIALYNLSEESFYYSDKIVNTFLDKMNNTLSGKVEKHEEELVDSIFGSPVPAQILVHMLDDKFRKSSVKEVSQERMTLVKCKEVLRHVVKQRYEERVLTGDIYDSLVLYLSGEQQSLMEVSYTKQQQKQKQTQKSKDQDSDTMAVFDKKNRLDVELEVDNYYESSRTASEPTKAALNLPTHVPILTVTYEIEEQVQTINVFPTLQFLYSHHIHGEYINDTVRKSFNLFKGNLQKQRDKFLETVAKLKGSGKSFKANGSLEDLKIKVLVNYIRQNPLYTLAALSKGVYIMGMKDQFNVFDRRFSPLRDEMQYISDEMGFILYDKTQSKSVDKFGPYFVEQYILLEILSKHEVAQNVIEYYCRHKSTLMHGVDTYLEKQGKGFICWRFLMNEAAKRMAAEAPQKRDCSSGSAVNKTMDESSANKKARSDTEDNDEEREDAAEELARVNMTH